MIYFAYGSNLDPVQMRERCPGHTVLGRAYLADHRLCFPRRSPKRLCGTAGVEPCIGAGVWGAIYMLTEADAAALHAREGHLPGRPAGESRHRVADLAVRRGGPGGAPVAAFTYLPVPDGSGALPSPDYMGHIIRGAMHHGHPADYIEALRAIVTEAAA